MHQKKTKILRGNQNPYVNETLRSAIMKRSHLKHKAMKSSQKNDTIEYKKQRSIVVKLNNRCKKELFDNLETKNNFKTFWSTWKSYFSNKHTKGVIHLEHTQNFPKN